MATNKHATIRYHALDKCFSNFGRKFFIEDLIAVCNEDIYDFDGIEEGVKKRQVFEDIKFMESGQGWSIPLERMKEGKRVYYRYSDRSFSIRKLGISQSEAEQLKDTIEMLTRFKGLPHFEWIEEMQIRLEDTFKLKYSTKPSVGFEQNPFLEGLKYFEKLFNAIKNETALRIRYKGFKQKEPIRLVLHPWYLKQYNNRWFLFGLKENFNSIANLALDRIIEVEEVTNRYIKNEHVNFEEYFDDIIGVTLLRNAPTEKILIKIDMEKWPYVKSKPIHSSQKVVDRSESAVIIQIEVQINYELVALIFSHMDSLEVIGPQGLREKCKTISESLQKKYS